MKGTGCYAETVEREVSSNQKDEGGGFSDGSKK